MRIPFSEALKQSVPLFDGSMGALLSSMGHKSRCPELLNVEKPEVIRGIHQSYRDAGCNVIITNSLGVSGVKLAKSNLSHRVQELVRAAVLNARAAAGEDGYVALDIGSTGEFMEPVGSLSFEEMLETFAEVCEAGKAAGADFALLETQTDIAECRAACIAAKRAGLEVIASFTFEKNGRTLTGGSPECCALTLEAAGAFAMGINCSGGPLDMLEPLSQMRCVAPLPVVVQPNAGLPVADAEGNAHYPYTPEMMLPEMERILEAGASAIGGCCGTTPEHIRLMHTIAVDRAAPQSAFDGKVRICSQRNFVSLEDAKNGLCEISDLEDLYDLEEDDLAALIDICGMSAEEAEETVNEAQFMTKTPLCFRADGEEALRAALTAYHGAAGVEISDVLQKVADEFGAKRL